MTRRPDHFVLKVNPILCDGFGHCHELAPELVRMDEWGYPILRVDSTSMNERGTYESARLAVRGCPRQALRIERVSDPS
jgi:ferredoxin